MTRKSRENQDMEYLIMTKKLHQMINSEDSRSSSLAHSVFFTHIIHLYSFINFFCLRSQMSVKTWKDDVVCWREEGLSYEEIRKKCLTIGIKVTLFIHMKTIFGIPRLLRLESGVSSLRDTVIKRSTRLLPSQGTSFCPSRNS